MWRRRWRADAAYWLVWTPNQRGQPESTAQRGLAFGGSRAVALAFQGAFDSRYRGAPPMPLGRIEDALAGEAELLGPYD